MTPGDSSYGRAYVTMLYLLGDRGPALAQSASGIAPEPLVRALTSDDRGVRVAALANEVAKLRIALDEGSLSPWS
jgi:hypothetical protein